MAAVEGAFGLGARADAAPPERSEMLAVPTLEEFHYFPSRKFFLAGEAGLEPALPDLESGVLAAELLPRAWRRAGDPNPRSGFKSRPPA